MERVYLIGFMASGKSTVGKELAARLGYEFYDLDTVIEQAEAMSIPHIFALGETVFREKERQILQQTTEKSAENSVIAVGGGTPCFGNNLAYMQQHGTVVFLNVEEDVLENRLKHASAERPMLQQTDWHALLHQRLPVYREADYTIHNNGTPQEAADKIIETTKRETI